MIHVSNSIIKSSASVPDSDPKAESAVQATANTTGQITVSTLVSLSKLIGKRINPIPSTIYRLFQSVIAARKAAYSAFQQIVAQKRDPEIERSNITHKRFIDALIEAFEALGGDEWVSKQKSETESADEEDFEEIVFTNQFSTLGLNGSNDGNDEDDVDDGDSDEPSTSASQVRPKKKATGKGKKGKRGKKARGKPKPGVKEPSLDEVPLESYRIIEDESGIVTDYLLAVYSLIEQWVDLRQYVQGLWREVSYGGLNSAVAGTLSKIAIGMIKQAESSIFVDFPGHESYETVMKTITRGDPEKAQGQFHVALHRVGNNNGMVEKVHETDVDVKEQVMIHAYWDLLAFVTDFQNTRSGKPTKAMMSEIGDWDPNFDLQRASKEQRIKWRRSYTINWLYDLVNVFSSVVVQRNTMKGQHWLFERVDWSVNGPWHKHRRLFGLNEFAGEITSLAMQKPGTDVRNRILPHVVFELQCIVDSLTVSRGWSVSNLRGHILAPPARGFRPRRDVDLFLDRENKRMGHGFCQGVDILLQFFEKDAMMHGDPNRHQQSAAILKEIQEDFINWLGESKYMHGLTTIPPSRFSNTNSNGLWEYSPFLCGVGLIEGLELAYEIGFAIWDRMPEPMCLVHLHNMLVQKGYISKEIGLFTSLQDLFPTAFFVDGKAPTSDFHAAFLAVCSEPGSRRATFQRRAIRRTIARTAEDLNGLLNVNANRLFKNKSLLSIYREAGWDPARISDDQVPVKSVLGMLRILRTKHITDPTGKRVLERTPLVNRAISEGLSDETLLEMSSGLLPRLQHHNDGPAMTEAMLAAVIPEGYTQHSRSPRYGRGGGASSKDTIVGRELLEAIKLDIITDVSGERGPLSSLNYIWVATNFMILFTRIEDELKRLRNPLWVQAYEENPVLMREKRLSLTSLVLAGEDDECLEVMAEMFQNPRSGFMQHIYWEHLDTFDKVKYADPVEEPQFSGGCTVM
jgi:hypothetical protein